MDEVPGGASVKGEPLGCTVRKGEKPQRWEDTAGRSLCSSLLQTQEDKQPAWGDSEKGKVGESACLSKQEKAGVVSASGTTHTLDV